MPMTAAPIPARHLELGAVVDLDEHVEARGHRLGVQPLKVSSGASAATMSRIASAPRGQRLDHLVGVDDEVLAQDRQRGRRAGRRQIVEAAREAVAPR